MTRRVSKLLDHDGRARLLPGTGGVAVGVQGLVRDISERLSAEQALRKLEPLIGEWSMEATSASGEPWPGGGRMVFEWHDSGAHLVQRGTVDHPEAPNNISIIGCDAANETYVQLYSDARGVCRIYEMSIDDKEWKLWRNGEPFSQRFIGTFSAATDPSVKRAWTATLFAWAA